MNAHDLVSRLSSDPGRDMDAHLLVLYSIARFLPARTIIEVGVDDGSSTLPLLLAAAEVGGVLHSIDVAPCPHACAIVDSSGHRPHWVFHQMESRNFSRFLCPSEVDLVLIDGDHSREGVASDWLVFSDLTRVGGIILFHDYMNTQEFPGISELIERDIRTNHDKYECATLPYGWGLTIVRKLA